MKTWWWDLPADDPRYLATRDCRTPKQLKHAYDMRQWAGVLAVCCIFFGWGGLSLLTRQIMDPPPVVHPDNTSISVKR